MQNGQDNFRRAGKTVSHKKRNRFLALVGILLAIGMVVGGFFYYDIKDALQSMHRDTNAAKMRNVDSVLRQGKPISILLLGTDTGTIGRDYKGRTDSIMVVTINPKTNKTLITSLPRDTMVSIPGYENRFPSKLNAAYAYGSADTAIKTVQTYLNVPIDFYALVNMRGLEKVVNKVGGIKVKSPLTFTYNPDEQNTSDTIYKFTKGETAFKVTHDGGTTWQTKTKMNGADALAFSRMRYDDPEGDYGRTKRQRLVLEAMLKKANKASTVLNRPFLHSISDMVQTDMTFNEMLTIASKYRHAVKDVKTDHMQGHGYAASGQSFELVPQSEKRRITNLIRKFLGLPKASTGPKFGGSTSVSIDSNNITSTPPSLIETPAADDGAADESESESDSDPTYTIDTGDDESSSGGANTYVPGGA